MTKKELITTVAAKLNVTYESAENAVITTMATITQGLVESGTVAIPNFGIFAVRDRAERMGWNPHTGEPMIVPAQKVVAFKAGKVTLKAIREPRR